jgi:hypothetical protein
MTLKNLRHINEMLKTALPQCQPETRPVFPYSQVILLKNV